MQQRPKLKLLQAASRLLAILEDCSRNPVTNTVSSRTYNDGNALTCWIIVKHEAEASRRQPPAAQQHAV
jgi:hypothetical protein